MFATITMFIIHPFFSLVLFLWLSFFIILNLAFAKKINKYATDVAQSRTNSIGRLVDNVTNINNIRLFARENFEADGLKSYLQDMILKDRKWQWLMLKLRQLQGLSCTILIAMMLVLLGYLRQKNLVTIGDFALILALSLGVVELISGLSQEISDFSEYIGGCNQALSLITTSHEITDQLNATNLQVTAGSIEFKNVTFNYIKNDNLFQEKSIIIPGGQKVGLVGYSGSGKTSFVNLIVRLFEVNSGSITIDGQNINEVTQASLRENIGFIPQDPLLFHRTLQENIRYGRLEMSDTEVINAAKSAYAHEFITQTCDGYETLVGERGVKLSGG
jgi:ATP-binding cassette subfamily B protein